METDIETDILSSVIAIADLYGWVYVSSDRCVIRFKSKNNDLRYAIVSFDSKKNRSQVIFGESIMWDTPLYADDLECFTKIIRVLDGAMLEKEC